MMLRTKGEQKAYLDGYEMCAQCIEKYLTDKGRKKLECLLMAVRNAVEIADKLTEETEEDTDQKSLEEWTAGEEKRWESEEEERWVLAPWRNTLMWLSWEPDMPAARRL